MVLTALPRCCALLQHCRSTAALQARCFNRAWHAIPPPCLLQAASALGDAFLVFSRSKAEGSPAAAACVDPSDDQVGWQID